MTRLLYYVHVYIFVYFFMFVKYIYALLITNTYIQDLFLCSACPGVHAARHIFVDSILWSSHLPPVMYCALIQYWLWYISVYFMGGWQRGCRYISLKNDINFHASIHTIILLKYGDETGLLYERTFLKVTAQNDRCIFYSSLSNWDIQKHSSQWHEPRPLLQLKVLLTNTWIYVLAPDHICPGTWAHLSWHLTTCHCTWPHLSWHLTTSVLVLYIYLLTARLAKQEVGQWSHLIGDDHSKIYNSWIL